MRQEGAGGHTRSDTPCTNPGVAKILGGQPRTKPGHRKRLLACSPTTFCHLYINTCLHTLGCKPLPWRLTTEAIDEVDRRVCEIVYPHGINGCSKEDISFLKKAGRTWRTSDKITTLLCILPTVLRGFVPAVRAGFRKMIWGLRILEGRCLNGTEAATMRVHAGSHPISVEDIERADLLINEGLSMLEGVGVCHAGSVCVMCVLCTLDTSHHTHHRHHHRMQSQRLSVPVCTRFYSLRRLRAPFWCSQVVLTYGFRKVQQKDKEPSGQRNSPHFEFEEFTYSRRRSIPIPSSPHPHTP